MAETEEAPCIACGSASQAPTGYARPPYAIVQCEDCRLHYLSPRLVESEMLERYRSMDYFEGGSSGYDSYAAQEQSLRSTFRRLLHNLHERGIRGSSILDLGCGYGYFLAEAAETFDTCVGTEMSRAAADRASAYGRIHVGEVVSVPPGERFDVIVALHVLEHVYRPVEFLEAVSQRLSPGGWLVIAVPNMASPIRRLLGRRWPSFKFPEHVAYYDRQTLRSTLERVPGLTALVDVPYPHAFPLGDIGAKLGLRVPQRLKGCSIWVPTTTTAVAARAR